MPHRPAAQKTRNIDFGKTLIYVMQELLEKNKIIVQGYSNGHVKKKKQGKSKWRLRFWRKEKKK